jgi:hypothetical protein
VAQRNDRPAGAIPQTEFGLQVRLLILEKKTEERVGRSSVFLFVSADQLVRRAAALPDALRSSFSGWITTPSNGVAATKRPCTTLMWRNG